MTPSTHVTCMLANVRCGRTVPREVAVAERWNHFPDERSAGQCLACGREMTRRLIAGGTRFSDEYKALFPYLFAEG